MSDNSIINISGDLTKPLSILIEKIADATGVWYEPIRIRRNSIAESDAKILGAETDIKIADMKQRALDRLVREETRKQENMESIIEMALPQVSPVNNVNDLSEDWIAQFFDKCRLVSDRNMQEIWAKILSGEVNHHGLFSSITIDSLSRMGRDDAILFSKLCSLCIQFDAAGEGIFRPHLISPGFDASRAYTWFEQHKISFSAVSELECLGLILEKSSSWRAENYPITIKFRYFETEWERTYQSNIELGSFMLTRVGKELFNVVGSEFNKELVASLPEHFRPI